VPLGVLAETVDGEEGRVSVTAKSERKILWRTVVWIVAGAALVALFLWLGVTIPKEYRQEFFTAKLGLLAITAALATFQWGVWNTAARQSLEQLRERRWAAVDRRAEQEAVVPAPLARSLRRWHSWRLEATGLVLWGLLPFSRAMLTNALAVTVILLFSCIVDIAGALLAPAQTSWHGLSLGSFVAVLLPILNSVKHYASNLLYEFSAYERAFADAREESNRRLAQLPPVDAGEGGRKPDGQTR
jgi:hypothetical protein